MILICSSLYAQNTNYYIQNGEKVYLHKISNDTRSLQNDTAWYQKENGDIIGIKKTLFVMMHDNLDINELLKEYNLTIIKRYTDKLFLLKSYTNKTLSLTHKINSTKKYYAYPNIAKKIQVR